MSIINQMLRDLEKRTRTPIHSETGLSPIHATVFSLPVLSRKKYKWIQGILVLILTALILNLSYKILFNSHKNKQMTAPIIQNDVQPSYATPVEPTSHGLMKPLPMSPALLTTITLQIDKDTTLLRFLLSQDVLYRVKTNQNQLIIVLENSRLVGSLPSINTINSAIKDITMVNQGDGNLEMILTLKEGAELSRLELNENGSLPELQLDLLSTAITDPQTTSTTLHKEAQSETDPVIKVRTDLSMRDQYQEALKLSTDGHSHEAIKLLSTLLNKDPDYADVRESLASLLIAQGNTVRAGQLLQIGLQQRPFFPAYVQLKAKVLVNNGKINEALNLLQKAPPTLAADPEYHAFIAALYQREGQVALAEKMYEQLLSIQPNNGTWWLGLGIALESLGKTTLATEAYLRARNSDHLNPELKVYAQSRVNHLQQQDNVG